MSVCPCAFVVVCGHTSTYETIHLLFIDNNRQLCWRSRWRRSTATFAGPHKL